MVKNYPIFKKVKFIFSVSPLYLPLLSSAKMLFAIVSRFIEIFVILSKFILPPPLLFATFIQC